VSKLARPPIITLTTDFGLRDYFVGVIKGVILQTLPEIQFVDISHEIPRHDIISGAFVVNEICSYFPPGTVHLVVIDPGVGTDRKKIVVCYEQQFFVAPDNGLLTYILNKEESRTFEITSTLLKFKKSPTFAGRDHFAPIATALASGTDPGELGVEINDAYKISGLSIEKNDSGLSGKIVYFDYFGNAITNIRKSDLPVHFKVMLGEKILTGLKQNYSEGDDTQANLIINSSAWLEFFVPGKSAKVQLSLSLMDVVSITNIFK